MPAKLKVDFHTHTADDPKDYINFSAEKLIDRAAQLGFDGLAITNHDIITHNQRLEEYAAARGVLLIPGAELTLSGKHVLLINPGPGVISKIQSLEDLASIKDELSLVIAPHPYHPGFKCLRSRLETSIALFDAVEFSFFYNHLLNPNRKAVQVAGRHGKPLVGDSDCHNIWQLGTTYTRVEAEKNIPSIIRAVKQGKTEVVTAPLPFLVMARVAVNFALGDRLKIPIRV